MPKDVIITPALGLVDFQGNTGISSATIELDNSGNLNIGNNSGDIVLGDGGQDIYVGNGVANVDIVFEQDGEIRGLTGVTVSLGQTDSYLNLLGILKGSIKLSDGPLIVGSATSTGTASQNLQITGGGYISGNVGVGDAVPDFKLDVAGNVRVQGTNALKLGGTGGTTNFSIQYNSSANSLDFVAG